MIGTLMYSAIITLYKQGHSKREVAKLLKIDRKTVGRITKAFEENGKQAPSNYYRDSRLSKYHAKIIEYLESNLSAIRIYEELGSIADFKFSYSSLVRYISKIKVNSDVCIRFHTLPGIEAQVDFGEIGKRYNKDGIHKKAYIFNMRLSYSRKDYYEVVFDQKIETWIKCHINAFRFFGGVTQTVKIDNLKSAVVNANVFEPLFQKEYARFAEVYNFSIIPCTPKSPQEKGKIESGIKYIQNNFFAGRRFASFLELEKALICWLNHKCNSRIHGTTRRIPDELFDESEKSKMQDLPATDFHLSSWHIRKVQKDCHIHLLNNYYSVPFKFVGTEVEVSVDISLVRIYSKSSIQIAVHSRSLGSGNFITNRSHYPEHKLLYPGSPEYKENCEVVMKKIGTHANEMLIFLQTNRNKDWTRIARGILALRKDYSDEILDQALKRALYFGITSYSKIKDIITSNCYNLPLPESEAILCKA